MNQTKENFLQGGALKYPSPHLSDIYLKKKKKKFNWQSVKNAAAKQMNTNETRILKTNPTECLIFPISFNNCL